MTLDQVLAHLRKRHQRIGRSHRPGAGTLARPVAVHITETKGWIEPVPLRTKVDGQTS
jgi:hypothetical protein